MTAPIATPLASHITSKGMEQSNDTMIGVDVNFYLRNSNSFRHASSKMNFTSFSNNLHKVCAILKKS